MSVLTMTLHAAAAAPPADRPLEGLVARLQRGDESAFEPFIQATQRLAFKLAWQILHDYHAAQDVVQESYLAAFRTIRTVRDPKAAQGWFLKIVTHRCIGALRKARPETELPDELVDEACLQETSGRRLILREALKSLSPPDRHVILLREVLDLPYDDIAVILGVPLGTVKSRLSEARKRLAHKLSSEVLP
ncbi:MAG TPA: RNA polymerase sigma factor [Candidatus Xenobia bacterium]|jgi:RNA polymerase sigma-70 factor (ECF subfamily)